MIDMASKHIIPAVIRAVSKLAESMNAVANACPDADVSVQKELLLETSDYLSETKQALSRLIEETDKAACVEGAEKRARVYHDRVVPEMEALRAPVDKLEMIVDKSIWPMPSYGDLIFEV